MKNDTVVEGSRPRVVSAPLGARDYTTKLPGAGLLVHAVEIDEHENPIRALCERVKPASILHDSSQYDIFGVTCKMCFAKAKRLGISVLTEDK